MADVQLEHGFLRIANALDEAITYADFSGTHMKIVRCIVRLTYGWRRRTVRVSHPELADRCGLKATGGFRKALEELIANKVVIVVQPAVGSIPAAYAINKNFERWGRFAVAADRLDTLFAQRLGDVDYLANDLVPGTPATAPEKAGEQATPPLPSPAPSEAPALSEAPAPVGNISCPGEGSQIPYRGTPTGSNPPSGNELEARKDSSIHERQLLIQRAEAFAVRIVGAANNANAERFGEWTRTKPYRWDSATQLCVELLQTGVDVDIACEAVATAIRLSKKDRPANGIAYFANAITDAHASAQQRVLDRDNPAPAKRGGRPVQPGVNVARNGDVSSFDRSERERQLRKDYDAEQQDAGVQWGKENVGTAQYRAIVTAANEHFKIFLDQPSPPAWVVRQRDTLIIAECAKASGFPSFAEWRQKHEQQAPAVVASP